MRLIDADALDRAFTMLRFNDDKTLKHWGDRQNWCMSGKEIEDLINSVPTIEPERKTGRWVSVGCVAPNIANVPMIKCTVCGHLEPDVDAARTPYCSHCGAYMKGGEDD